MAKRDLLSVDWSSIPRPIDDGLADHLLDMEIPSIGLMATNDCIIDISKLVGIVVIYAYPRTGVPGASPIFNDWDTIPGARGCTPQSCSFRDYYEDLLKSGASYVFGLSTQDSLYQKEAVKRLHLPFDILSDKNLAFSRALKLPTFGTNEITLLKRITLIIKDGVINKVFYPVFPPDKNAEDVIAYLENNIK
jgi:peroxiredoxin